MNNNEMKPAAENASRVFDKKGRLGAYTVTVSVIVLAVIIVLNLLASLIPSTYTVFDTTSNSLFTLSETTRNFVSGLGEDIDLYWLCAGGTENPSMRTFLDRYHAANSRVKVTVVDPVADPNFTAKYTDAQLSNYSVIVSGARRSKAVDFSSMSYFSNGTDRLSYDDFTYYYQYYGEQFITYYGFEEYFNGDSTVTGAIEYVVAENVPTIYLLSGHNEAEFSSRISEICFSDTGIPTKPLNIALDDDIPADCTALVINAPQADLTAGEAKKLIAYLDAGGKILLITDPGCDGFSNLSSVTQHFGMAAKAGTVSEGDAGKYYSRNPQYIIPTLSDSAACLELFNAARAKYGFSVLMPAAHGIASLGAEGVTVTPLMTTSASSSTDLNDVKQSYDLAAAAESGDAALVWIASSQLLGDSFVSYSQGGNLYFFYFILSWACSGFSSTLPEIEAIRMSADVLTVTEGQANAWGNVLAIVIPLLVIGLGILIVVKRRRRA